MKRRMIVFAMCAAMASLLLLAGCSASGASTKTSGSSQATPAKVVVGTLATEDILPYWIAESEGMFAAAGVDATVEVFQSATELISAVTSGDVDMAMTDIMVTASIFAGGTDVSIQWITLGTDATQGRFGIMTSDPSITSLTQLAGRGIGVGSNTILEYVMDCLMKRAGVADDQIVTEELQKLPVRYQACVSGQVAAAALPGSLLALGEANGCHVVADDTQGENISQSVMIVRQKFLEQEGGTAALAACKNVWNEAVAKVNASPESYRALLVEKANLSDAIAATYPVSTYPTCELPTQKMVDDVLTWMNGKGYLQKSLTYNAEKGTFAAK